MVANRQESKISGADYYGSPGNAGEIKKGRLSKLFAFGSEIVFCTKANFNKIFQQSQNVNGAAVSESDFFPSNTT